MKVTSKGDPGLRRLSAVAGAVFVATLMVGTIPGVAKMALALVPMAEGGAEQSRVLAPVQPPQKAEEMREPSGLEIVEAEVESTRKPTRVRIAAAPVARASAETTGVAAGDGWRSAKVSWYGPGFYGNTMAGGGTLTPSSMVVAHKSMAFGTRIEFSYNGRTCVAVVADRGPYAGGRIFDLGPGTAAALGFSGVGTVQYRIVGQ